MTTETGTLDSDQRQARLRRRGRLVLWAVLAFVLMVPVVNIKKLFTDGIPVAFDIGDMGLVLIIGVLFSIGLIAVWVMAYRGDRKSRVALGVCYLAATALIAAMPLTIWAKGASVPTGWQLTFAVAGTYGLVGWVLLFSDSIKAFQSHQLARRRGEGAT